MDTPNIHHGSVHNNINNNSNSTTQSNNNNNNNNQQHSQSLQLNLSSNQSHSSLNPSLVGIPQSKNVGQMSALAYSQHLHSVMGSMPLYDMGDYQHL